MGVYICLLLLANYLIKNEKFHIIHTMFTIIFICFSQIPLIYFAKLEGDLNVIVLVFGLIFTILMSVSMFLQVICDLLAYMNLFRTETKDKMFKIVSDPLEVAGNVLKSVWLLLFGIHLIQNNDYGIGLFVLIWGLLIVYYIRILIYYVTRYKKGISPNVIFINIETLLIFLILYIGTFVI
ncbi:hypothetical protein [Mammaliicoccus sciuri]|uniref:hypothetical protein n=1 Tax=Mammaliicoccus sciuri TaxID=1296 RepID=UPI00114E687F|nr:hypothetical protein [Mammaliicoccus sciuri]MCD8846679.1 hypothetical protein [Mammaliicoccus sciuri]MCJ0970831.1 hypothetical protein [Mammaliicoccus sciuri]MEB6096186.1 hypothetical protein [Mammaliicoccus sciuri]MEB6251860.1 hypothetical protein [Mammaliicoccus sciuri]MEB6695286.1 hypothetical protein [Mammaliicoccus sciuri]